MTRLDHEKLAQLVQQNCHISDAKHAGSYTLCIYLLKMREYYRWETSQPFSNPLSADNIGQWLSNREDLWQQLEEENYRPVEISNNSYDPFDSDGINKELLKQGLIYSGGIGHKAKPHFFLAKLERKEELNGYQILISSNEYARDLTSPPAMSQHNTIYIRRESFKRMIWEKIETWQWNKPENAMARALECYDFSANLEDALEAMTNNELESTILHEIGEIKAGEQLPDWSDMMSDITFTQSEIMARAVRDHLADAVSTLPTLLEQENEASIHFYFANLTNMRKHIFPSLESAYQQWIKSRNVSELKKAVNKSKAHWQNIASQMLSLHNVHQDQCSIHIESLIDNNHL